MSFSERAEARATILRQAADQCSALRQTLDALHQAPNRFTRCADPHSQHQKDILSNICILEASLASELRQLDYVRSALAPVARLPDDVLRLVFLLSPDTKTALQISWTCRRWRAVALDTRRLWTCIRYSDRSSALSAKRPPWEPVGEWDRTAVLDDRSIEFLERSKGCPLTVELQLPGASSRNPVAREFAITSQGCVESLDINATEPTPLDKEKFLRCVSVNRLQLKKLRLSYPAHASTTVHTERLSSALLELSLPLLTEVGLMGVRIPLTFYEGFVALRFCRKLMIRSDGSALLSPQRFQTLLRCCPLLVEMELVLEEIGHSQEPHERLPMPHLEHLTVQMKQFIRFPFYTMSTPKLQYLTIKYGISTLQSEAPLTTAMRSLLQESRAYLESLTLDGLYLPSLNSLLSEISSLRELNLDLPPGGHVGNGTFQYLQLVRQLGPHDIEPPDTLLCPKLEIFRTTLAAGVQHMQALYGMAKGRSDFCIPLKCLSIGAYPSRTESGPVEYLPMGQICETPAKLAAEVEELTIGRWRYRKGEESGWVPVDDSISASFTPLAPSRGYVSVVT